MTSGNDPSAPLVDAPATAPRTDGLARGAVTVASLTALFGAVSLAREQATAYAFGAGPLVDAFLVANAVPAFLINTAAGVVGPVFAPIFSRIRRVDGPGAASTFAAATLGASVGVGILVGLVLAVAAPWVPRTIAWEFAAGERRLTTELLYLLLPVVPLSSAAYVWAARLMIERRFASSAFAPVLQPIGGLVGLAVGGRTYGIHAMAAGISVGALAQVIFLAYAIRRGGQSTRIAWPRKSADLRMFLREYWALFAGSVLMGATALINQSLATTVSSGAVAHLAFGNVVVLFVVGLGARTIGQVLLPHFAGLAADRDWKALSAEARRVLRLTLLSSTLIAAVLMTVSTPLIRLIFERGAFTPEDTLAVSGVQRLLALQIPWYLCGIVTARLLTSLQMTRHMLGIAGVGLVLTMALNILLASRLGINGIALGSAFVYAVCFGISWRAASRRLAMLDASVQ